MEVDTLIKDRYLVQKILGKGAFGSVLLAQDNLLKRNVALKVLHIGHEDKSSSTAAKRDSLVKEARTIARFEHHNIVTIYDVTEEKHTLYIVMQFIEGENLADTLAREKIIDPYDTGDTLLSLLDALEYAHSNKVVHRDIKPANIMINKKGDYIFTDFGLAKILEKDVSIESGGGVKGTPGYMSPEQLNNEELDGRTDLFSFTCVLYEMTTGEKPFGGRNVASLFFNILRGTPRHLEPTSQELPLAWKIFLLKGLEKERIRRFKNAAEYKDALKKLLSNREERRLFASILDQKLDRETIVLDEGSEIVTHDTGQTSFLDKLDVSDSESVARERSKSIVFTSVWYDHQRLKFSDKIPQNPETSDIIIHPNFFPADQRRDLAMYVLEKGLAGFNITNDAAQRIILKENPTLDDMLACTFVIELLEERELPTSAQAFARYSAMVREGLQPGKLKFEESIEAMFLAVRNLAGEHFTSQTTCEKFIEGWKRMAIVMLTALHTHVDPFTSNVFASDAEFARENAFLSRDFDVYQQDVRDGQRFRITLPGGPRESSALFLDNPKSLLFKFWSRKDSAAPAGGMYVFLAVRLDRPDNKSDWTFTTDPVYRLSLKSLAEELQKAEMYKATEWADHSQWFDGKPFNYTLVGAPLKGTELSDKNIMKIVRKYLKARKTSWI
ncbi:serine/threonine protein kinase [candidate division CSSED10-310 bacterium]|uniref:non-specific serine/threonine protein kinase n=1 Tax=candidate division CSSED10-310 bacterium TaxID=2855610 RepID=A0ABV6YSX1_UNCC1